MAIHKLFISNIDYNVTEKQFYQILEKYFTSHGTIMDAFLVLNTETKLPRGFGFMTIDILGNTKIDNLLNTNINVNDRTWRIKKALSKTELELKTDTPQTYNFINGV